MTQEQTDLVATPRLDGLDLALEGGIARITMTRGAAGNPLTVESARALLAAMHWAASVRARVVVLGSDGPAWCVGGDLKAFAAEPTGTDRAAYIDELAEVLHRLVSEIVRHDAIVVAAVDGVAAGAGMPLACAADLVVASDRARFTLGYTKIGLTPDGGSSLLATTVGLHTALRLALLNPVLSADDSRSLGLVAEVVTPDVLDSSVDALAARLAAGPPGAQAATKHLLRGQVAHDAEAALRRETLSVRRAAATDEAAEGIAAFLEKRPPSFS